MFNEELFKPKDINLMSYLQKGVVNYVDISKLRKHRDGSLEVMLTKHSDIISTSKDYTSTSKSIAVPKGMDGEYKSSIVVPIVVFGNSICLIANKILEEHKVNLLKEYNTTKWGESKEGELYLINVYEISKLPLLNLNPAEYEEYKKYLIVNEEFELLHELKDWNPDTRQITETEKKLKV